MNRGREKRRRSGRKEDRIGKKNIRDKRVGEKGASGGRVNKEGRIKSLPGQGWTVENHKQNVEPKGVVGFATGSANPQTQTGDPLIKGGKR